MPQTGVSVRRAAPISERASRPHLALARDVAAEDMAEIARSGIPGHVRSTVSRSTVSRRTTPGRTDDRPRPVAALRADLSGPADDAPRPRAQPAGGVPGRRTVTITGQTYAPARRRPQRPIHQRPGFQPDRFAMWAVLLGMLLVLIAALSAHA